ncbi:MAG: ATP-binding protein [Chlamydiales bacterium]
MEKEIRAEMGELEGALRWVRECCAEAGLARKESGDVELAMEEIITNIIRHAYAGKKGEISLVCNLTKEEVQFIVKDSGVFFNPVQKHPKVDPTVDLDERKEGGLGIFFVEKLMDRVNYERQEPFNILRVSKKIP